MDGADAARIEQGDWPTKIVCSDKCMLGFPTSKSHYQVDVYWSAGRSEEGDEWAAAMHSFWCRWSFAEALAKDVEALVSETAKEAAAKPGILPPVEPLDFALPSKWWGDRGDLAEITKRMTEMNNYLVGLRDWGAGLEPDTALWDRVRLTGPIKVFLCQPNETGHPTGGASASDVMFTSAEEWRQKPKSAEQWRRELAPVAAAAESPKSSSTEDASPPTPMDRTPRKVAPQLRAVTATYLFSSFKAVAHDVLGMQQTSAASLQLTRVAQDPSTAARTESRCVIIVDCGALEGPDSRHAALYRWLGADALPAAVQAAVSKPGNNAKFHDYNTGKYVVHAASPDFRAPQVEPHGNPHCSQEEAETILAATYAAILRQFLIAVSELPDASGHDLRLSPVSRGAAAGRFAEQLDVMTYNALSLALSELTSAERARLAFEGVTLELCVSTQDELDGFEIAGFSLKEVEAVAAGVDDSVEAATVPPALPAAAEIDQSLEPEPAQSVAAELAALDARIGIDASVEAGSTCSEVLDGMDASVEVAPKPAQHGEDAAVEVGPEPDDNDDMVRVGAAPAMSISVGAAEFEMGGSEDESENWLE